MDECSQCAKAIDQGIPQIQKPFLLQEPGSGPPVDLADSGLIGLTNQPHRPCKALEAVFNRLGVSCPEDDVLISKGN